MAGKVLSKRNSHSNDISEEEGDTTMTVRFEWVRKPIVTVFETNTTSSV